MITKKSEQPFFTLVTLRFKDSGLKKDDNLHTKKLCSSLLLARLSILVNTQIQTQFFTVFTTSLRKNNDDDVKENEYNDFRKSGTVG